MQYLNLFLTLFPVVAASNNVCKSIGAYFTEGITGTDCYYNPEQTMNVPQIIQYHNRTVENHTVTTDDGYILTVFRIPSKVTGATPVFLMHGIYLTCACFVNIGVQSLAFLLSDQGYDVWLGNFRGNRYASNHTNPAITPDQYWNFSFHELGTHDYRSQISYVFNKTAKKVVTVGYSMGTTAELVYTSKFAEEAASRLQFSILLAPIAFMNHVSGLAILGKVPGVESILNSKQFPNVILDKPNPLGTSAPQPYAMLAFAAAVGLIFGYDLDQINPETMPITQYQNNAPIPKKVLAHYVQCINTFTFAEFNNGPAYNLANILVNQHLIYASNDLLSRPQDVQKLYDSFSSTITKSKYLVQHPDFNHNGFVSAKNVRTLVYDQVLSVIAANI